jgi:hypothetical protein
MGIGLRPEEEWARGLIAAALGLEVVQHDDGSADGMHDLDVYDDRVRNAAVEVTAAADGQIIALWKLVNPPGQRWIEPALAGGWMITLRADARAKRLRGELPALLEQLETAGIRAVDVDYLHPADPVRQRVEGLGIASVSQGDTDFPGSIYLTVDIDGERSGGFIADDSNAVAAWLSEFLADDERSDVRHKLERSGLPERHAFVIVPGFSEAPFTATDPLARDDAPVPTVPPSLPAEISHVWVMSTWSSRWGFRWSPSPIGWQRFAKGANARLSAEGPEVAMEPPPET